MRTTRLFLLLLLVTTVVGCSANRLLYNRADTFIRWAADDYVTLNREQQAAFDQRLDDFLAWHRSEELPRYREFIVTSLGTLEDGVTLDEAVAISEEIDLAADRFQGQFIELLLATAEDLSDEQIQDFLAELERNQAEYADERLVRDAETYYADSVKTMKDLVKRLIGRLNRDQRAEIEQRSMDLTRLDGLWHDDRARWGRALRVILEAKAPGWQAEIRKLGETRSEARIPEYVAGIEHNGDVILALLVDIINSRTERQDRRMRRFLEGLVDDIDALTAASDAERLVVQQG
ncbi:MAG: hypothetical protein DWQ28_07455 [Proteobacteria bacterium]|nr:MAG: hypothetical protein DWQ28_07455 [Pseudomonadota bacterium]